MLRLGPALTRATLRSVASLAAANLTDAERRALARFVELLVSDFGSDLHGVWLYGSRARGEGDPAESDVDVLVITRGGRRDLELVVALLWEAYGVADAAMGHLTPHVQSPEWVADRRAIESFFIQEVDHDKIVLYGRP